MRYSGRLNSASDAPRLATQRWPAPVSNDRWSGRCKLRNAELARAWQTFLVRVPWEMFATLTFDGDRISDVGSELASREAFWWCGAVAHLLRRPVGWAYVVERGRCGSWHAHALLAGAGTARWIVPKAIWRVRNGHIDLSPVTDVTGVASYTSKWMTDDEIVLSDTLIRYKDALRSQLSLTS